MEAKVKAQQEKISIHALREEGDLYSLRQRQAEEISIHALREEGDLFHADGRKDAE